MKSRSMRLFQGVAIASTLAASAFAFVGGTTSVATAATSKLTIGFVIGAEADPFFQAMFIGASAEAKALNVNLIWSGNPEEYSPATQLPFIQQVAAQRPNAMVIAPTDTKALEPTIAKIVKSGTPVFNVDSHDADLSNIRGFVTGNNTQGGQAEADLIAKAIGYSTNCTAASKCNIDLGVSSLTTSTDAARVAGATAELKAKYPNIVVKSTIQSNSQSAVAQAGFTQNITSDSLKGILAVDGTDTVGGVAAAVAANAGHPIPVVGYDAYAYEIADIQAGTLYGVVAQQPALEGKYVIAEAVDYLRHHKTGEPKTLTLANASLSKTSSAAMLNKYEYPSA